METPFCSISDVLTSGTNARANSQMSALAYSVVSGHHSPADSSHYQEISGRLNGLLIRLSDRMPARDQELVTEFIDANELSLALEQMADGLSEDERPLLPDERGDMLALAERMELGERVPRALERCPSSTQLP